MCTPANFVRPKTDGGNVSSENASKLDRALDNIAYDASSLNEPIKLAGGHDPRLQRQLGHHAGAEEE